MHWAEMQRARFHLEGLHILPRAVLCLDAKRNPVLNFLRCHSLLLFIGVTGIGWAILFWRMDPQGKWGKVVGNIVSEWLQMAGLVFLTKRLIEKVRRKVINHQVTAPSGRPGNPILRTARVIGPASASC